MANGFMGKILWINLSDETFKEEELPEEIYRQFFGGYGLASKLIYERMPANTDALSPEAILGFFPGLLTGTVAPLSGRFMVAGKSPLTGTWGDANCGGYFGPEIKRCGYDGILILGMASNPIYIVIDNEKKILDASELWGLDATETEEKLKEKHGKVQVASIGQAGEKLSLISGIVTDKGRIAARSGLGAVMGSKNLKAIVLKGDNKISVIDKEALIESSKKYNEGIKEATMGSTFIWKNLGTSGLYAGVGNIGDTPIKNWGGNTNEDFPRDRLDKLDGMELVKYKKKPYGCFSCSVQCGAILAVPEANLEETHRPEYETCASFGAVLLNDDIISLFKANELCNRAGMDVISAGMTIAFAIECYENGILTKDDADGLELTWGNADSIIKLLKKMINREGIGDILADGVKRAAEKISIGSEKYALHSLGQELPMHDSKHYPSLASTYAFDPTPGRHTASSVDFDTQGVLAKPNGFLDGITLPKRFKRSGENRSEAFKIICSIVQIINCLGLCEFTAFFQQYPIKEIVKAVTNWDLTNEDLMKVGLRIQTLRQAFTLREGVEIASNTLPGRAYGEPPFESGPHKRKTIDYIGDYKGYCEKMGWNPENGYPLKETLSDLGLDFVIKDLYLLTH